MSKCATCGQRRPVVNACGCDPDNLPTPADEGRDYAGAAREHGQTKRDMIEAIRANLADDRTGALGAVNKLTATPMTWYQLDLLDDLTCFIVGTAYQA